MAGVKFWRNGHSEDMRGCCARQVDDAVPSDVEAVAQLPTWRAEPPSTTDAGSGAQPVTTLCHYACGKSLLSPAHHR